MLSRPKSGARAPERRFAFSNGCDGFDTCGFGGARGEAGSRGIGREWRAERTRRVGSASDQWMTSWRSASATCAAALVPAEPPALASLLGAPETEARLGGNAGRNVLASIPPTSISDGDESPDASYASAGWQSSAVDRISIEGEASCSLSPERESEGAYPFNTRLNCARLARPRDAFPSVGASMALFFIATGSRPCAFVERAAVERAAVRVLC